MQIQALKEVVRDAIGETKAKASIGPFIGVLLAAAKLELAILRGDRLDARRALWALCRFMGWSVTVSWVCWATSK